MSQRFVLEDFLRLQFPGWYVPGAVIHSAKLVEVEEPGDALHVPQHGATVMVVHHAEWLRAGHDPGDEDEVLR